MRFPKEKVLIPKEVNDSLNRGDFFSIFKMKNRIIDNFEVLEPEVFSRLLASTFIIGNFDEAVIIGLELRTRGIETYDTLYYLLLSLIANNDIYQALSIINRSKLLNRQEIKNSIKKMEQIILIFLLMLITNQSLPCFYLLPIILKA